jgi:hypothetical protein
MIYTLQTIEDIIRSELNETSTIRLSDAEVYAAINDATKDIAAIGLCCEHDDLITTISGCNVIKFSGIKVNYIEIISPFPGIIWTDTASVVWTDTADVVWTDRTGGDSINQALLCIPPSTVGHIPITQLYPEYWYQWGNYIILHRIPNSEYVLKLHIADYPNAALSAVTDISDLPVEFHSCIIDFALYTLCIKLRRWTNCAIHYNNYINNIQRTKAEYVKKIPDKRWNMKLPDTVEVTNDRKT